MVGVTGGGGGVNFWASENLSGRVHFEGYTPEWRVLSKLSVQPCESTAEYNWYFRQLDMISNSRKPVAKTCLPIFFDNDFLHI